MDIEKITRKRLGELLVSDGVIGQDQLAIALEIQAKTRDPIGEILVRQGFTNETEIAKSLCIQFGKPFMRPSKYNIDKAVLASVPPRLMAEHQFIPIDRFGNVLVIAMAGLLDGPAVAQLQKLASCDIEVFISTAAEVKSALRKAFPELFDPMAGGLKIEMSAREEPDAVLERTGQAGPVQTGEISAVMRPIADDLSATSEIEEDAEESGTAEDWEALFEEAEQKVFQKLEDAEKSGSVKKKTRKA